MTNLAYSVLLYILVGWMCPAATKAQLPEEIKDALLQNATWLQQGIEVEYTKQFVAKRAKLFVVDATAQQDNLAFFERSSCCLVLQPNRWMADYDTFPRSEDGKLGPPEKQHVSFDGGSLYLSRVDDEGTDALSVMILDEKHLQEKMPLFQCFPANDLLENWGFVAPSRSTGKWYPIESAVVNLVERGAAAASITRQGSVVDLKLINGNDTIVYTLDANHNFAVTRIQGFQGSLKPIYVVNNSEFTIHDNRWWFPRRSVRSYHTWQSNPNRRYDPPLVEQRFLVSDLRAASPKQDFSVEWTRPGTEVADSSLRGPKSPNGFVNFRVPANLSYLDKVMLKWRRGHKSWMWWLLVPLVGGSIFTIFVRRRMREKTA